MRQYGLFIIGEDEFNNMSKLDKDVLLDEVKCSNHDDNLFEQLESEFQLESAKKEDEIPEGLVVMDGMKVEGGKLSINVDKIKESVRNRYAKIKDEIANMDLTEFMLNKDNIVSELSNSVHETLLVDSGDLVTFGLSSATYTATDYALKRLRDEKSYIVLGSFMVSY